ncbi:hypothetical protein Q5752_002739 [Cryptotrichosporon argae]
MDYTNLRSLSAPQWTPAQDTTLLEPYAYISGLPGKEIRAHMIDAFNLWLAVPEPELDVIRKVVRMLHNASLLMDDVEDASELRRGQPVAHAIFGVPQAINAANYVYFLAVDELLKLRGSGEGARADAAGKGGDLVGVVTEELLNLHRGQGLDLFWRDSLTCPTEEEYIHMVLGKTGGLFRLAVKLMMAKSESNVDYVPLVNLISIAFQIRDDYMNLQSDEYEDNKGYCEDLTEGKFSFPVVHGVRADPSDRQILNVLQKRTTSRSLKSHIVQYLATHTKSFEYTRGVLRDVEQQVRDEIRRLGGNRILEAIVDRLAINQPSAPAAKPGDAGGAGGADGLGAGPAEIPAQDGRVAAAAAGGAEDGVKAPPAHRQDGAGVKEELARAEHAREVKKARLHGALGVGGVSGGGTGGAYAGGIDAGLLPVGI